MKYFSRNEVECNCGCHYYVENQKLFDMIEHARMICGFPFQVNSWCRCIIHNKSIGGSKASSHIDGDAIDIHYNNDRDLFKMIMALQEAGFMRILIYPKSKFIHVDISTEKFKPLLKIMEQKDK